MSKQKLQFSHLEIQRLFPFFMLIDDAGALRLCGQSMLKILPDLHIDEPFFAHWSIVRPKAEDGQPYQNLSSLTKKLVVVAHNSKPDLHFKGQFERLEHEDQYLFLGSPWFSDTDQLIEHQLTISDFAFHDSMTDLLHVLRNNEIANSELKEVVKKVNYQKQALQKSNEQLKVFQSLINNSSDAVQVSYEDGQLFYINNEASERLGIDYNAVNQYNVKDFEKIFEQDEVWQQHVETLKKNEFLTIEGQNINQLSGEAFPVEVTVKYLDIAGKGYVIANSRDITDRKKNEKQLRIQEEKYRNIIANMNLGLLEVDNDDFIQYCNQSFTDISGYSIDEIKGLRAGDVFLSEESKKQIKIKNSLRQTGTSDSFEIIARNKRGEARWWLISGAPNTNDQGEIIGSIGIHLDITDQKRLENELEKALLAAREASEAKEAFLANMSHEIRTPLNGIIGMVRALGKEDLSIRQKSFLDSAAKASQHLLSIINNILDINKIEAGELQIEHNHFSLHEVLKDIAKILQIQAAERQIALHIDITDGLASALVGDATRIRQILINLVGNAIKFTEQGFVRIHCAGTNINRYHQKVVITIEDTGIGMDARFVRRVFTKFQQEDKSTSRKYGGTGLGLVITKELIDLMNGNIDVQSKKGEGSTITIQIPLLIGDPAKIETVGQLIAPEALAHKSILLVEDNEMNRMVATNVLSPYGFQIVEAENGAEAVEILTTQRFDLILMDLQMPIMGGLEATRVIRNTLHLDTPIIALTANAFKSEIDLCLQAGMNDYVVKPFEEKTLINALNKSLSHYQLEYLDKTGANTVDIDASQLYDLSKLKEMSRGNAPFVVKMLQIFVSLTTKSIEDMQVAWGNKDIDRLRQIAHKIKPSIDDMGIQILKNDIRAMEQFPADQAADMMQPLVQKVTVVLQQVVQAVQNKELAEGK
jgi:PAS domain S-box-containing protein